jgi:hypothetical protein
MATKDPTDSGKERANRSKVGVTPTQFKLTSSSAKPVVVEHHAVPPRHEKRQSIHRRRRLPRVKEGKERAFHSTSRDIAFHLQRSMPVGTRAATDDLSIQTNSELTQPGQQQLASSVGEPSLSANGQVVMYTGNWYAARSGDGGQTFQYLDPFTAFPDPPNLGYCCDQVVNYIASIDTFVWLLQYGPKSGPDQDNIQRLAFAKSADVVAGKWRLFDITTQNLGLTGQFLDFPDLAVGANFLYVTSNVFTPQGQGAGAIVVRLPISSIDSGQPTAQTFPSTDLNSFRVVQNCGATAFFAAHLDTSTLRVFAWPESESAPTSRDVGVARWIDGQGYQSRTPDQQRWLDRIDSRITGATMAGQEIWFAWSVDAGSNHRPNPFVQIARIDSANLTLLEDINIFDPNSATAYGALSSNADDEVGISYMIGGSQQFPSHMVGILTGTRKDVLAAAGDRGTADGQWGDFLTVRPLFPNRKLFVATGYTMKGAGDGSNRDAIPRYVVFGRASDVSPVVGPGPVQPTPPTPPPAPPVPPGPLPPTPPDDGQPIADVNTLQVVTQVVADQIKKAAGFVGTPGIPQAATKAAPPPVGELDKPGVERWPVKTGQDQDRAKVGKNVINGVDLGTGIVPSTVEELISLPRPGQLMPATQDPPQFKSVRVGVTEVTIWQIEATIIALKHESDGDYHLVLQGVSGAEMVAEVPTPTTVFVGDSPWLNNIGDARAQVDDKLVKNLSPQSFALVGNKYLPHGAMTFSPQAAAPPGMVLTTPKQGSPVVQPLFSTQITPTQARITGVGFFDRAHGATGAAPNVIELHPVLKVEWL